MFFSAATNVDSNAPPSETSIHISLVFTSDHENGLVFVIGQAVEVVSIDTKIVQLFRFIFFSTASFSLGVPYVIVTLAYA